MPKFLEFNFMRIEKSLRTAILMTAALASTQSAQPPVASPLANGVYALVGEGSTEKEARAGTDSPVVVVRARPSEANKDESPKYVALEPSSFVPLVFAGPPVVRKDDRGASLDTVLAPREAKRLEALTRTRLGQKIAVVIDGEIVSMPVVRSIIQDGKAKLTGCESDDCKALLQKLRK
jgi:preprotein translocase subunit SecD